VICDRKVGSNTLYGRLKEDRPTLPDTVHDTESFTFTNTDEDSVITSTCQDGDDLYTEAQINKESPLQSSRREMSC
jgi:hypothetical protein